MSRVIWKYTFPGRFFNTPELVNPKIIHFDRVDELRAIWVEHSDQNSSDYHIDSIDKRPINIGIYGTGQKLPIGTTHIGSVAYTQDGTFLVDHAYDIGTWNEGKEELWVSES